MPARLVAVALAGLLGLAGAPAPASAEKAAFNVSFGGLRAGVIAYDADVSGASYTARGAARPSGLIGAIFDATIDTVASGAVEANSYRPRVAREITRDDGEVTERTYRYDGGVPAITRDPPRAAPADALPPHGQAGTVDTTTAAFAILRDRPAALACALDISIYDGRRRHRIRLNDPTPTGDGMTCRGEYVRVAGFDPDDLDGKTVWPLEMDYARLDTGAMRVMRLSFPTSFGTARITRR